jgi:hypothetical protein
VEVTDRRSVSLVCPFWSGIASSPSESTDGPLCRFLFLFFLSGSIDFFFVRSSTVCALMGSSGS